MPGALDGVKVLDLSTLVQGPQAAAMLHDPRLLIVDEPMVGLDPRGAEQIKAVFRERADSGNTVFLSTHSLDVAQEVCDRLAIINKGRIVAQGTYEELRSSRHGSARDLVEVFLKIVGEESAVGAGAV